MTFLKTIGAALYTRVFLSYRSTLITLAISAAIVIVDTTTTYLQALPEGWAKAAAAVIAIVGTLLKAKQKSTQPSAPPAA